MLFILDRIDSNPDQLRYINLKLSLYRGYAHTHLLDRRPLQIIDRETLRRIWALGFNLSSKFFVKWKTESTISGLYGPYKSKHELENPDQALLPIEKFYAWAPFYL